MADIDGAGALEVILDRMDRLCCSNDYARRELREARQRVRDLESENRDLRAENDLLRRRETPRARGQKARIEGLGHKVPLDLRNDPAGAQEFVEGWASRGSVDRAVPDASVPTPVDGSDIPF